MNASQSPLFWSFPIGSLFATRIRLSIWFLLLPLILVARLDFQLACALTVIFLVSTLLHELIGHVLVARSTGGDGHEVLLWPIGGLAWVHPAPTFVSHFFTAAGGPLTNLLICLATLPTVLWINQGSMAFNPFVLPIAEFSESWGPEFLLLVFFVNWMLALVNLLPIYPLDGGRMVEASLIGRGTAVERKMLCVKIGTIACMLVIAGGLMFDNLWVVTLGSLLLVLNILEGVNVQWGDAYDDSFMGYDFSQGYTSLERSAIAEKPVRKSFWERRREQKQAMRLQRQEELRRQEELLLDELLAKVHASGINALTPQEKKFLQRTSKNFRTKKD